MGDIASGNASLGGQRRNRRAGSPYVDVPVNVTAAAKQAASGLMVYIREVNKAGGEAVNLHVRVHSTTPGGQDVTARMFSRTPPIRRTISGPEKIGSVWP